MTKRPLLFLVSIVVAILLIVGGFSAAEWNFQTQEQPDKNYVLLRADQEELQSQGYEIVEEYDSFVLAKASGNTLSSMQRPPLMGNDDLNDIELKTGNLDVNQDTSLESISSSGTDYYMVKTIGPVKPEWKDQIKQTCSIVDYLPENTYVVKPDNGDISSISEYEFVYWAGQYKPQYRISPELDNIDGKVTVDIVTYCDSGQLIEGMENLAEIKATSEDEISAVVHSSQISDIAEMNGVAWIAPSSNIKLLNHDAQWTVQSGSSGNRPIWDEGLTGEGQVVGISDTGIDYDHAAFRDPQGDDIGSDHRKIVRYVAHADDHDLDSSGHGTHTSGSIAGNDDPFGSNENDGMAKNAKLSFFDVGGEGDSLDLPSDYADIFQPAYDDGARIHSNSWGGADSSYTSGAKNVDEFMWNHKDMLIFYANGNSGPDPSTIGTPATAKNLVSVGASGDGNREISMSDMADFSSRGPTDDGRMKPTIVAPGQGGSYYGSGSDIISADSDGDLTTNNNGYTEMQGTSMACPVAAGSATLVRQYFVDGYYPEGTISSPSAALIKSVIVNGAVEISGDGAYKNTDSYPNSDQGWGRMNLDNALEFSGDSRDLEVHDVTDGVSTGTTKTYTVNVDDTSEPFEATLAYTDYPGSTSADKALVNDLNLKVTAPDGTVYKGNMFSGKNPGQSTSGGSYDDLNPLENVLRLDPQSGEYTVEVIAENVPNGPQPFALTLTGGFGSGGGGNSAPTADFSYSPTNPTAGEAVQFTDASSDSDGSISSYSWSFGDGSTSTQADPTNTYSSSGTYTVELTVEDNEGATDTTTQSITVESGGGGNSAPTADFSYSPTNPTAGEAVQFTDASSDSDGSISSYSWSFGDGSTSTQADPTNSYSSSGTYTVELTVTDNDGATDSTTQDITVESGGGGDEYSTVSGGDTNYDEYITNVQFNGINKDSGDDGGYADHTSSVSNDLTPGQAYELSVTLSTGGYPEYVTVAIDWDQNYDLSDDEVIQVGNGDSDPLTVSTDITVPSDASEGQTRMRVMQEYEGYHTDPTSNQDYGETEDYTVSIGSGGGGGNTAPTADFSYSPTNPTAGEMVQFTDGSSDSDGSISSYSWSFGDGSTSTQADPTYTYSSSGTYTVELTVTDNEGATDTATQTITVESGGGGGDEYSTVSGGDTSYGEYITNVQFNGINEDSGDDGGYADHTSSVSDDVTPGESYTLSVTLNTGGYPEYVTVAIDWDQNYDLGDDEVIQVGNGDSDPLTVTEEITVPSDVTQGQTRMRIMQEYEGYHTDPTSNQDYGETEDYTVSIGSGSNDGGGGEMSTIYEEDFESDTSEWSTSGLWHLVDDADQYGDANSGSHSMWYGQDSTGNYDTGSQTTGTLSTSVDLSGASQAELVFNHWFETENYDDGQFDKVKVLVNGEQVYYKDTTDSNVGSEDNFAEETIDISSYAGETVDVEFVFDSVDGNYNDYQGWYVDDVAVNADA